MVSTIVPSVLTATVGDPSRTRTVYAAVLLLVALAIALVVVAMWLVRATRPDPEVLGPLELMGTRSWRRADQVGQRRQLDDVRPDGAKPLDRSLPPPAADPSFGAGPLIIGFDDLIADIVSQTVVPDPVEPVPVEPKTVEPQTLGPETVEAATTEPESEVVQSELSAPDPVESETIAPESVDGETAGGVSAEPEPVDHDVDPESVATGGPAATVDDSVADEPHRA